MRQATPQQAAAVARVAEAHGGYNGYGNGKSKTPVFAYVNHGRWVADCECGGAELVATDMQFLCGSCGLTGSVEWPPNMTAIERILDRRPNTANQNWKFEPVGLLEAENKWMAN